MYVDTTPARELANTEARIAQLAPDRTKDIAAVAGALQHTIGLLVKGELAPAHADVAGRACETLLAAYEAEAVAYRRPKSNTKGT